MDDKSRAIMKASGVAHAASILRVYASERRTREQISARTAREFERAIDALLDEAHAIRNSVR